MTLTTLSDAVGLVLFYCFIKYFIYLLQEGAYGTGYIDISNTKYSYFICSLAEDYDDHNGECEQPSSVLSGPTLRLGD